MLSQLQRYSIGIVAKNKPTDSKIVEVYPQEVLPMTDGEITDNIDVYEAKAKNQQGQQYQVELSATNTIQATWLPLGTSNRITAPDVRRGEQVQIYRFGTVDKFYWSTLTEDLSLRKLETVVYAFSATKKEDVEMTEDNTYFFEISSHTQTIRLHTSQDNGEVVGFDIQLDMSEGTFLLQDTKDNVFSLESLEKRFLMTNSAGTKVEIDNQDITLKAPGTLTLEAAKTVLKTGNIDGNAGSGDLVIGGISHVSHTHTSAPPGLETSGPH